jgi:putative ABC transport system permease protein
MYFLTFLLKNLLRRRTRSLLTVLGVVLAVGTIVTLRGLATGFEDAFLRNLQRRGTDLVVTASGVVDQLRSDLDERIGPKIAQIPGVARVTPGLLEFVDLQKGDDVFSAFVNGWEPGCPLFNDLTMLSGRTLRPDDRRAVLLGVNLARNLGKGPGDAVEMQRERFTVVGVYESFDVFEDGGAVVPLAELQQLMARPGSVTGFSVALDPSGDRQATLDRVRAAIEDLKDDRGRRYRISAKPTAEYVHGSLYIRLAHGMAWLTSAIALGIGAVSMLNTMIMSVMERTREIGILRAIGWRRRRVVRMVLGEALLLSLAGAAAGAAGAMLLLRWLATVPLASGFVTGRVAPAVLAEGLLLTLLVALVGGSYPAYRAARMLPTEALRHE